MAAVAHKQIAALTQRRGQIEALDAPARPSPFLAFTADDDGGPIKILQHTRSDNADHADVPHELAFDQNKVAGGIEAGTNGANHFVANPALDLLTFRIPRAKTFGDGRGFSEVAGQQQVERFLRVLEASRRVQARAKLKAHFVAAAGAFDTSDFFECDKAGAFGVGQPLQAGAHEDSVLTHEWDKVSDRAERDEVEKRSEVELLRAGQVAAAAMFQQ